jgi:hypothetical protein
MAKVTNFHAKKPPTKNLVQEPAQQQEYGKKAPQDGKQRSEAVFQGPKTPFSIDTQGQRKGPENRKPQAKGKR